MVHLWSCNWARVAWSFRLYTGSLALQPSVVTAPSTPPVLETGDYGGGWSTGFGVFFVTASRQVGALLSTSLFGVRRIVVRTGRDCLSWLWDDAFALACCAARLRRAQAAGGARGGDGGAAFEQRSLRRSPVLDVLRGVASAASRRRAARGLRAGARRRATRRRAGRGRSCCRPTPTHPQLRTTRRWPASPSGCCSRRRAGTVRWS